MSNSGRAQGLEGGSSRLTLSISLDWLKRWGPLLVILLLTVSLRTLQLDLFYTRDELVHWRQSNEFFVALWHGDLEGTNTGSNYPQVTVFWLQALFNLAKYIVALVSSGQVSLMEAVVDQANLETAWKNVKANRGARPTCRG